jgi:hypothetical protein
MILTFGDYTIRWTDDEQTGEPTNVVLEGFNGRVTVKPYESDAWCVNVYSTQPDREDKPLVYFLCNEKRRAENPEDLEYEMMFVAVVYTGGDELNSADTTDVREVIPEGYAEDINKLIPFIAEHF